MRLRITFSKQGALRYTGHLDLYKVWERSLRRARIPLAYRQGFHPQPRIQLAAALPLGFASRAEIMDIWLNEAVDPDSLPAALQEAMPPGLSILGVEQVDERAPALQTEVFAAEYEVEVEATASQNLAEGISAILEAESLPRERRGKPYDLRPLIEELSILPGLPGLPGQPGERLLMRLAAREGATGRPEEVLAALGIPLEETRIERTRLLFRQAGNEK